MASLIEGFEYDIFISYRQKDNEYDGWVTDFVNNLKRELNATFKEEISVYFDANPHDGLLETHTVKESLSRKLKSLIFIPIISQTYCDPKSFAWQNELCTFNKLAKEDFIGREVTLPNGNVASRILPVKIHELDSDDKCLLESELGGLLRSIEFIYKSIGVNRPLRSAEDHPMDNLCKTYYRDQINKVANAVKEIIQGIKGNKQVSNSSVEEPAGIPHRPTGKRKARYIVILAITVIVLIFGLLTIPGMLNKNKSIAVLPFYNDSQSADTVEFIVRGFEEAVRDNLQMISDLRVVNRTSVEQYRNNRNRYAFEIARKLRIGHIVEGSAQISGNELKLIVRLIRSKKKEIREWGKTYKINLSDASASFAAQGDIAKEISVALEAEITPSERRIIDKRPTENRAAYDYFLIGKTYWTKLTEPDLITAKKYFDLALEKDPDFALAYAGLSDMWLAMGNNGYIQPEIAGMNAVASATKALSLDSTLYQVHYSLGLISYLYSWDWKAAENDFLKAIKLNPNHAESLSHYANLLNITGRTKEAQRYAEKAIVLDPLNPLIKAIYAVNLLFARRYEDAVKASEEALALDPSNPVSLFVRAYSLQMSRRYEEAFIVWKESYLSTFRSYENLYGLKISHAFDQGYAKGGLTGALKAEADTILNQLKDVYFNPTEISTMLLAAGESKRAVGFLKKAIEVHDPNIIYVLLPLYDDLRGNMDFQELCKNMNLPYR